MDFIEKARIQLEHWITHNEHHQEDYEAFAKTLEEVGRKDSAMNIREMMTLTSKGTVFLRKALESLDG